MELQLNRPRGIYSDRQKQEHACLLEHYHLIYLFGLSLMHD